MIWNLAELHPYLWFRCCGKPVWKSSGKEEVDRQQDGLAAAGAGVAGGDGAAGEARLALPAGGTQNWVGSLSWHPFLTTWVIEMTFIGFAKNGSIVFLLVWNYIFVGSSIFPPLSKDNVHNQQCLGSCKRGGWWGCEPWWNMLTCDDKTNPTQPRTFKDVRLEWGGCKLGTRPSVVW